MPLIFSKLALGVDWSGEGLNLVALGSRLGRLSLIDSLHIPDPTAEEARPKVAQFLDRNRLREARVTACLPRADVLVRFLDLPAEAERQLRQVVGYQIDVLHPFQDSPVSWDCAVVGRDPKTKQVRVMVAMVERSRLDRRGQMLADLGLRADSWTLAAACVSPLLKGVVPPTALLLCGREQRVELLAFHEGKLCATQEIPVEPAEDAGARLERDLHSVRAVLPVPDPALLPVFACGNLPGVFSGLLPESRELPALKLRLTTRPGFDLRAQLPAFAAAFTGLERKPALPINLLPLEQRSRPERWVRVPVYALGGSAALLALVVAAQGWIEKELYSRALDRQIELISSRAAQVRRQTQQESALAERAAVLTGARDQTWRKLQMLQEITRLLPDDTWLQEVQIGEDTAELYGYSSRAADLIQPLESSPYFAQVEFTSPITRDAQNKEVFRIRMRLKQSPGP